MRIIEGKTIKKAVEALLEELGYQIDSNYLKRIKNRIKEIDDSLEKEILKDFVKNATVSKNNKMPLCQDTGVVSCFVEIGDQVHINGNLNNIINKAVKNVYLKEQYRLSIVNDPFERKNTLDNTPASISIDFVKGESLKIMLMLKGGGSENVSFFKPLLPTNTEDDVIAEIKNYIAKIGAKACPPYLLGVAIGGDFVTATKEAKKALFKDFSRNTKFEEKIINAVNELNIGAIGSGGITCLGANVKLLPTHIASCFLAVSVCCNAVRKKVIRL